MAPVVIDNNGEPLLIFEPPTVYAANNAIEGYWGPVASSIDWCEHNYVVSFYVAEMFNTVSNCGLFLLGLAGVYFAVRHKLEWRFAACHLGVAIIGLGSAAFHGTLTHVGQQGDETPMILGISCWLWALAFNDPEFEARHPTLQRVSVAAAVAFNLLFAATHYVYRFTTSFQLLTAAMITTGIARLITHEYRRCADPAALCVGRTCYIGSGGLALLLWLCDQHFCVALHSLPAGLRNPQFHAWWHILMGVMSYCGPTFLGYARAVNLGGKPAIRFALGVLPYVDPRPKESSRRR